MATGESGHCTLNAQLRVLEDAKKKCAFVTDHRLHVVDSIACYPTVVEFVVKTKVFNKHVMRILVQVNYLLMETYYLLQTLNLNKINDENRFHDFL